MTNGNIKIWWEIWVRGGLSPEQDNRCYTPRRLKGGERSVVEERSDEEVSNLPDF